MSRKFCVTVYRALASPGPKSTGLQLWRGALASCNRTSTWSRSRRPSFAAREADSSARWSGNWCGLSPVVEHPKPKEGRRICGCHSLARAWKRHTCRWKKRTARVVQHQSPGRCTAADAVTTKPASPEVKAASSEVKLSKERRWKLIFRLCTRLRVQARASKVKKSHPWRRSSTILDMVPLSFFRTRILPVHV